MVTLKDFSNICTQTNVKSGNRNELLEAVVDDLTAIESLSCKCSICFTCMLYHVNKDCFATHK